MFISFVRDYNPSPIACAEDPVSSIVTCKARHHCKRVRPRWHRDTAPSVIPLYYTREGYSYTCDRWTVDDFDEFLKPLTGGQHAGRDGVGTTGNSVPSVLSIAECYFPFTQLLATTPVGRIGDVDDIAHLVSYLASKQAAYITGELREY